MALSTLFLVGCGSNSGDTANSGDSSAGTGSDGKVKLTFWDENAGPDRTPIWEELIDNFEKDNPDIEVEYVGLPKDDAKSKIDAAIAAKDTPDVASLQTSWLPEFSVRDTLLPLDDYFDQSDLNGKINEGAIDFNKEIVNDGKLYGIPYTQNLDILWLREDLFKEKELEAPTTWD